MIDLVVFNFNLKTKFDMKKKLIKLIGYVLLIVMLSSLLASCASRRSSGIPHGCGKKSKRYYHGEFLEYR